VPKPLPEGNQDPVWPEAGQNRLGLPEAGRDTKGIFVMPNPKRRHSTRRTALRRSHDFLTAVGVSECPACHEKKLPHRACPKCGEYKGRAVVDVKEEAK
jgi:large subunit ribosomal protein L32